MSKCMKLEIIELRTSWAVRPEGAVGMMGWSPKPWTIQFFKSRKAAERYINQVALAVSINNERK